MKVTVFGSARTEPGEQLYEEAYRLGMLLGEAGHTVMTGGYVGTMEAVSRGAAEAGGHVVGITCEDIERWRPVRANQWVNEERRFPTLRARLLELMDACDVALALRGGPGTLAEVAMTWNQLMTNSIPTKPLVLIGPSWKETFTVFFREMEGLIPEKDKTFLLFADSVEDAVQMIGRKDSSTIGR
jgi:uncharacterized protein (TIGR00725 family)